jgi:hypothetical protein
MPALTLYPSSLDEPPRIPVVLSQGTSGMSLRVTQQFGRSDPTGKQAKGIPTLRLRNEVKMLNLLPKKLVE